MPFSSFLNQVTPEEAARVQALHSLQILDTAPEKNLDEAVRLAAVICGTPIALVNLLDKDRQWFKAQVGMDTGEMPRANSFCEHLIGQVEPMVVPDAIIDLRFRENPYVTGDPKVRFYAGMPLNTTDGHTLGTLCVLDTVPHQLTKEQTEALAALGRQVTAQIELQAKVRLLHRALEEKERIERELRRQTLLFGAFMDHSPTIGFMKDSEGRFVYYNRVFCEHFAVSPTEWIGKSTFDLFPMEFAEGYHDLDMAVLESGVSQIVDETSPGPDNTILYWRTHKFRIADGHQPALLGGLSLDISSDHEAAARLQKSHAQLEAANQQLAELSVTDGLTGLLNRRAFDARLATEIEAGTAMSLLILDIDYFKSLNDTFGHPAGDDVLRTLAGILGRKSRGSDCVARLGGEEFAILLIGSGKEGAMIIAERLRKEVEEFDWKQRPITMSLGLATRCRAFGDATELLSAADEALYRAKHLGRNRVEVASS